MESFDIAQAFLESSCAADSSHALTDAFQDALHCLGFEYFACCTHVNLMDPPPGSVLMQNYPSHWVRAFMSRRLDEVDPVLCYAGRTRLPFFWDSPAFKRCLSAQQRRILEEAADIGLDRGFTVPIKTPWAQTTLRASCSVVPDSASIEGGSYLAVQLMSAHLYEAASRLNGVDVRSGRPNALTKRQKDCLQLAAQGKTDWEIGEILKLSEHTVHDHIEDAKKRLGVHTRTQAIVHALHQREISFGDAIRANHAEDHPP